MEGMVPGPRRRLDPAARREQILQAAVAYFAEVGFGGPTRELAQRCGITQALLYKYFASKAELAEAVFERIYLGRLDPDWMPALRDRSQPLEARLIRFYTQYTDAIFTYEWMRIFMWSGLGSGALNQRYLGHVKQSLLEPLRREIGATPGLATPTIEDMWNLHGGIVYIGIRRFIYQLPVPAQKRAAIRAAVRRFLGGLQHSG